MTSLTVALRTRHLYGVAFGNDTFVLVSHQQTTAKSVDNGTTWNDGVVNNRDRQRGLQDIEFGNNTFVTVGGSGHIYRSTDNGSSFDNVTSDDTGQNLYGVAF